MSGTTTMKPWYRTSTFFIFVGLTLGVVLGGFLPQDAHPQAYAAFQFTSKAFIGLIKGLIVPLLFSTLFGLALTRTGDRGKPVLAFFDGVAQTMFKYTDIIMRLTPIGVFGAMAYNVSHMAAGHRIGDSVIKGWPAVVHLLRQYALL